MVSLAQIVVLCIGIVMLVVTIARFAFYRKSRNVAQFMLWCSIWALFVIAVLFFDPIREIGEGTFRLEIMDFFLFIAVIIIFFMLSSLHGAVRSLASRHDALVEHIALKEARESIATEHKHASRNKR